MFTNSGNSDGTTQWKTPQRYLSFIFVKLGKHCKPDNRICVEGAFANFVISISVSNFDIDFVLFNTATQF